MMLRALYFVSLLAAPLAPVHSQPADDEYALISAVLEHGIGEASGVLLIDDRTTAGSLALFGPQRPLSEVAEDLETSEALLESWRSANRRRYLLQEALTISATYRFLTPEERASIFAADDGQSLGPAQGWERLRETYPNTIGIVRVSRPGFDDNGLRAGVYVEFECGENCGSGRFVRAERVASGRWEVSGGTLVWIAAD